MLLDKLSTESSEPAGLEQNNYYCKFFRQKKMILGGRMVFSSNGHQRKRSVGAGHNV